MFIRKFNLSDLERVIAIEKEVFTDPYPSGILEELYNFGAGFLVVEKKELVVGFIVFWIKNDCEGHIISLAVDSKYQHEGVGSLLVTTSLNVLKSLNLKSIQLEVRKSNIIARQFYKKHDFVEDEYLINYYDDGEVGILMKYNKLNHYKCY
ncbi:MAG: ribosomal protein S18-alanine N-acetyltransferase [Methanobacteriaceae archaeon]|nr:ribosomal protein S18-alanine N-acetyltransferase [Methanobacteriaceae archaeon]